MRGYVRKHPETGKWQCTYYDAAGKRRAKSFTRKLDAERFLVTTQVDQMRQAWIDPAAGRITFGDYAREWVRTRPIRDSTRNAYIGYVQYMRELDAVPVADLTPAHVRTWQAALMGRLARSTARTVRGVAATIAKEAVNDRLIVVSPFAGVKAPPRPDRLLVVPYSPERVAALRTFITPRYSAAVVVGAGVALRRGEAFGLTVDRVDFLRREVKIDRQLIGVRDGLPVFGPPKTASSAATVPASRVVVEALAAHVAQYRPEPGAGWWRDGHPDQDKPIMHAGLIFTAPRGGPVLRHKVGEAWGDAEVRVWAVDHGQPLGRDHRIPAATLAAFRKAHPAGHGHRFHELRHFAASTLIAAGRSVKDVQAFMRHANAEETLNTYAHLWPADADKVRAAIDAALTLTMVAQIELMAD